MIKPVGEIRSSVHQVTLKGELEIARISDRVILRAIPPTVNDDNDLEDEPQRFELGRSNRRRTRTLQRDEVVDDDDDYDDEDDEMEIDKDEFPWNGRFASERNTGTKDNEQFADADDWDEIDDEYEYDIDDDETNRYDLLENIIIPNPLLDSMDPDGTIERLPELLSDPRFWFDMVLFILFLDFLSFAGPQSDPFIDFPWIY